MMHDLDHIRVTRDYAGGIVRPSWICKAFDGTKITNDVWEMLRKKVKIQVSIDRQ
jgi:hypothetical protein